MIIRREQFSALSVSVGTEFVKTMGRLLRESFEEAQQSPVEEIHRDIARVVRRAQAYGLETERDVAAFVITAFLLGENFDGEFPAAQQVLLSPVLTGADKAQWLEEWALELFRALKPAGE